MHVLTCDQCCVPLAAKRISLFLPIFVCFLFVVVCLFVVLVIVVVFLFVCLIVGLFVVGVLFVLFVLFFRGGVYSCIYLFFLFFCYESETKRCLVNIVIILCQSTPQAK